MGGKQILGGISLFVTGIFGIIYCIFGELSLDKYIIAVSVALIGYILLAIGCARLDIARTKVDLLFDEHWVHVNKHHWIRRDEYERLRKKEMEKKNDP